LLPLLLPQALRASAATATLINALRARVRCERLRFERRMSQLLGGVTGGARPGPHDQDV
jgi:hypothetical protein